MRDNNLQPNPSNQPQNQEQANNNNNQPDPQQYDTFLYKFQQQIIDAWKPVPHTSSNILLYLILTLICIGLGIALIVTAVNTQQVNFRYDNLSTCTFGSTGCSTTFTLTQTLQAPVYLYYGMTNFYQNHRRYIKFFSPLQLDNGQLAQSDANTNCGSFVTNQQLGYTMNSYGNATLTPGNVGFPCGTSGRIYNKFRPQLMSFRLNYPNGTLVNIQKSGIAWSSDIGRHKNWDLNQQPFSVQQQDWLVWYRPAARQNFFKLFGIVNSPLQAGTYTFFFDNTFNASFGQKSIFVGKSNYVGNRDLFLGIAFLVLGGGCLILLVVFIAKWIAEKRDKQHIN